MKHIVIALFLLPATVAAQDTLHTRISYDLTAETAVGTGNHTAYHLAANRHHVLSTRQNTAYLRGALSMTHQISRDWRLQAAVDAIGSVHGDHRVYLQQAYARLSWRGLYAEAGSREDALVVRQGQLSIGSFVKGTNAKPVPQVRIGTHGFVDIPFTAHWVQANFDAGYGKFMDSGYREDRFRQAPGVNNRYTTGAYYHQKHLYFRTNPTKPLFVLVGIEHAVQFGGTSHTVGADGQLTTKHKPANLKAFWDVILPLGDSNYFENESMEDWVWGNHIGVMTYQLGVNLNRHQRLQAYCDNPFEDGSGVRKGNGYDGLWGLQYSNSAPGRQWVRGAVVEYFQSTNQCGPLHWDSGDWPEPVRSQITDLVTGNDDYYNHLFYDGYSHYGMTPGIGLITSPIYNSDGYTSYRDNRIRAWQAAANGEIDNRWSYLAKCTYREGRGTYVRPLTEKSHSFDALLQGIYSRGPWQLSAAYALSLGNILGDSHTLNLKISYHGKLL